MTFHCIHFFSLMYSLVFGSAWCYLFWFGPSCLGCCKNLSLNWFPCLHVISMLQSILSLSPSKSLLKYLGGTQRTKPCDLSVETSFYTDQSFVMCFSLPDLHHLTSFHRCHGWVGHVTLLLPSHDSGKMINSQGISPRKALGQKGPLKGAIISTPIGLVNLSDPQSQTPAIFCLSSSLPGRSTGRNPSFAAQPR